VLILTAGRADEGADADSVEELLVAELLDDGGVNEEEEDNPIIVFFPFPLNTTSALFGEYTVGNHLRNNS
jgi:hypothetical protein